MKAIYLDIFLNILAKFPSSKIKQPQDENITDLMATSLILWQIHLIFRLYKWLFIKLFQTRGVVHFTGNLYGLIYSLEIHTRNNTLICIL